MDKVDLRLTALRAEMDVAGVHAVIIPSADPHQSEYVSDYWKLREYFSGFTGSAGTLVVTMDSAALWTDSRYFLQVEEECASNEVHLHKQSIPHAPEHVIWLVDNMENGEKIAIDFRLFSVDQVEHIKRFAAEKDIAIVDFFAAYDSIWTDRPALPNAPVKNHPIRFAGAGRDEKITAVRDAMRNANADFNLITRLDEIAWLFNIRGNDVDCTPLVVSYALVGLNQSYLFVDTSRIDADLKSALEKDGIRLMSYANFTEELQVLVKEKKVIVDKAGLNYATFASLDYPVFMPSFVQDFKTIKNETEQANAKSVMVRDGVALTRFFIWLEKYLEMNTISEYEAGRQLEAFRKEQAHYQMESFSAIVGYKGNGAIIHYRAPESGSAVIMNEGILLIDSGGQYLDGTTDITRTIWLGGVPSDEIKMAYTAVLKGYIELETMTFPEGTVGMQLDSFARMHLWRKGLNFPHGTGHGIGSYGMVHEPNQGFATSITTSRGSAIHKENQFTTIEPGCYKKDNFGIRTENVVVSRKRFENGFGSFLGFEPITLCYIDTTLIDLNELSAQEIKWLNDYHKKVVDGLSPYLNDTEKAWLLNKCQPIAATAV